MCACVRMCVSVCAWLLDICDDVSVERKSEIGDSFQHFSVRFRKKDLNYHKQGIWSMIL